MIINWQNLTTGEHKITLEGAVGNIEAILHLPEHGGVTAPAKAVVICCHPHPQFGGTMTNKVVHTLAKTFSKMGVPALRFNFRGIGSSDGNYDDGRGESEDLLKLSKIMQHSWPEQQLWLAGFSFGSWIAATCAEAASATQLLSIAPPVQNFDADSFNTPSCPWTVVMGEDDEVVEPDQVFAWIDAQKNPPQLIRFPETGHFFHGKMVKLSDILMEHYLPVLEAG